MRLKRSHIIAAVIAASVLLYFGVNAVLGNGKKQDAPKPEASKSTVDEPPAVVVQTLTATPHVADVVLRGRTTPVRAVVVRSETGGRVVSLPVPKGAMVKAGQLLCGLEVNARQAQVDQARANLRARELEYAGSQELEAKGFRSTNATLAAKAARDAALAGVRAAEDEMGNTRIVAPYTGVFDDRAVELGDVLANGQACGTVVDLNPILVTANATEAETLHLSVGMPGRAKLVTGQEVTGRIRFVARAPDEVTKTYTVELEVANPNFAIPVGVAAELRVGADTVPAHRISPSILALDATGKVGIRILDAGDIVRFAPVQVLEETPDGIWVAGLPAVARVITVGQDFVAEGKKAKVAPQAGAAK
jgi:multidrug efflux system membrane fusion protein